ncbi:MAG: imidazoleglycerol-phosphate dehydratase HisB [Acidimicrobiia bacterium]
MSRHSRIVRTTKETTIEVILELDGMGRVEVETGIGFFDHMLEQLGRHSGTDLQLRARGDLRVDQHHTVEDCGLTLGAALAEALGDKRGIKRFGHALVPHDEALAEVALDLSGRPFLRYQVPPKMPSAGEFPPHLAHEFWKGFSTASGTTLHVLLREGKDPHHCLEAIFKAVGRALGDAITLGERGSGEVPSTKGVL